MAEVWQVAVEAMAAVLGVRELRVGRDEANARLAQVVVVRRDPLSDSPVLTRPHAHAATLSLWDPIPVALVRTAPR